MSQENVEIVRKAIQALNRGDVDAVFKDAATDFELDASRAVGPLHGVYGLDQVGQVFAEFHEPWESYRYEPGEFVDTSESVVVPVTAFYRGRDGIEVQARVAWVWTFRDGAATRICFYQERQEALEAAGVSE